MSGPDVDMTGALAMAKAYGVRAVDAAPLLTAAVEGVRAGAAERKKGED